MSEYKENLPEKRSLFEYFTEVIGWLQIMASPFLIGVIFGAIIYFSNPGKARLIIAILVVAVGLVIGSIWASKVWKKEGATRYMSRIMSTPELDVTKEDPN